MEQFWFYAFLIIGVGFALLMGGFGIGSLITFNCSRKVVQLSQAWHEGKAIVKHAKIDVDTHFSENEEYAAYFPSVHYVYQVDGKCFQGTRINFGVPHYLHVKKAEETLAKYPPGCEVRFFYDPLCPADAVLERAAFNPKVYLILGIILTAMMVTLIGLLVYWWVFEQEAVWRFVSH